MKTFRSLAAALLILALGHVAIAQESSEVTSLRAKAEKGNGIAQYNLGLAYADGKGVARDPIEAFVWLSLARENGARGRALDNVAATLDKASLEAARQRIDERKSALGGRAPVSAAAKPATPAPAAVVESKPATPNPAAPTGADTAEDPTLARVRKERDAYSTKVGEIAADLFTVRTERDRLAEQAAEIQKNTRAASAASQSMQEQVRTAQAQIADLERNNEAMKAELARAKLEFAARAAAPKPAPDTAALEAKTRELQAALTELETARQFGRKVEDTLNQVKDEKTRVAAAAAAELEAARQFGRKVEDTLNKVNDEKARVAASSTAELEAARQFGQQVEATLNKVNDQKAALETQLATVQRALAAKPAAPGYPDLSGRVSELETQFATSQAAAKTRAEELARANTKLAGDETAFAAVNRELATAKASLAQANQALAAKPAAPKYPDLTGRVTELESALAVARKTAPAYPDLRSSVAALEEQLTAAKPAAPSYPDLRKQVGELETKLTATEKALATKPAAPNYPDLSGRVAELESALATTTQKLGAGTADHATLQAQLAPLRAQAATPKYPDLSGRVAELESQAQHLAQEVKRAEIGLKQAQESYLSLQAEADQLRRRPAAPAWPDLRERVTTLEAQLAAKPGAPAYPDLSGRVTELETALADASRQLVAARNAKPAAPAYPDLTGRVSELEAAAATSIQKFGAAEQARADVTRQFDDYKSATAAAQRERTTLQSSLKMLESDKASLRRQVETATTESNQLRTQVAALKTQAAAPKNLAPAYPDLSGQVAELEAALAAKPAAPVYADLSGRVSELEATLAAASQNAAAQAGSLTAERDSARKAQNELRDTVAKLAQEKAELVAAKAAAQSSAPAYPDLRDRVASLESDLAAARLTLAAKPAAPNYPDLSGRVSELETALAQAKAAAPPAYPDLSGKVVELESALAAKPAAPTYPNLADKVTELSSEVTQLRTDRERMQKLLADSGRQLAEATATAAARSRPVAPPGYLDRVHELEAALAQAKAAPPASAPAYPDLSGRVTDLAGEVSQLRTDRERMLKLLADTGRQMRDTTADTARIKELETQLAAAHSQAGGITSERDDARKAQHDLRDTLTRLEQEKAQLAAASPSPTPAYPDLSGRVRELESVLAATKQQLASLSSEATRAKQEVAALAKAKEEAQSAPAPAATPAGDTSGLEQKLADTESRLTTALRGYAALQRERDTLAENAAKSAAAVAAERDTLASQVASLTGQVEQLRSSAQNSTGSTQAELARLNEAVTTLQRTSTQSTRDVAAARTLAQQLQGANAVLAGENYQLKTMLARSTGGPAPATAPVTAPAARVHVVVAGDSLSRLSQRFYGSAGRWQEIYNANAEKLGPNGVLRVGTELRIP